MNENKIQIYNVPYVTELFGVTRRTVYNWIEHGKLKAAKVGKAWFISEESLREFIANGTRTEETPGTDETPED